MSDFRATNLATGEVIEYQATTPQSEHVGEGWRLEQIFDQPVVLPPDVPVDTRLFGGRRWLTKLEFITLIAPEYQAILDAANQSVAVQAWVKLIGWATPSNDATAINLDDPRTVMGLQGLQMAGLFTPERVAEILNG